MNRLLFSTALLFACSCTTPDNKPVVTDVTAAEQAAIRRIIEEETVAFANRDSTALFDSFADDPISHSCWNNADGTYSIVRSKEAIVNSYRRIFKARPEKMQLPAIKRTEWAFRKLGNEWVWVNFVQTFVMNEKLNRAYESRLMKRDGNEWKSVVVNALNDQRAGR